MAFGNSDYEAIRIERLTIPTKTLQEIGAALFGDRWVPAMARRLQVQRRTVQRWKVGTLACGGSAAVAILLLLERNKKLHQFPKLAAAFSKVMSN